MRFRPRHRSSSSVGRKHVGLLGLACGLALAACGSSGPSSNGPLGPLGNPTTTCTPLRPGEALSDGYLTMTNNSTGTLTIERVGLASPRNIRLLGAYIVPVTRNAIGDLDGWPPLPGQLLPGIQWRNRHRPAGARVRPGDTIDPVVGLAITAGHTKASENGQLIYYRDASGNQYVLHTNIQVQLQTGAKACPI
jgi:hypothetical protein